MRSRPVIRMALLAIALSAASASAAPLHWGPRLGVNASAFSGSFADLVRPDVRYFPNAGLALQVDLARNLSFRTEASWAVKGGGSESERTDASGNPIGTTRDTWRFEYLEIPLLVRTRLPLGAGARPYLEVGPSVAVALDGEFRSEGSGEPKIELRDRMNDLDVGFGGGFGLELPVGEGTRAGLEIRYTRGFSDLLRDSGGLTMINQAWTFAAIWLY